MGFVFGKYMLYIEFEDGSKGYFMGKNGDHVMVTSSAANADKWMSESGARNAFYDKGIAYGSNSHFSPVKNAWIYTDGKFFRMD